MALWAALGNLPNNIDDAYITLRYSANLAAGQGLVFNPGERVEGFSNPLWTLILAIPVGLGWDGLMAAKLLGLACTTAAATCAAALALDLAKPRSNLASAATLLGAGLIAVSHPAAWWATGGLETPSVGLFCVGALFLLFRESERPGSRPWSAVLAGLAAVSRPETPLLVSFIAAARIYYGWRDRDLYGLLRWLGIAATPLLAWVSFRLAYYPDLLPNTFYRKDSTAPIERAFAYVWPWIKLEAPFLLAGIGGVVLCARKDRVRGLALGGVIAAQFCFVFWSRGDWMPSFRFVVPALPLLAAGAGGGFGLLADQLAPRDQARWVTAAAGAVLFVQAVLSVPVAQITSCRAPHPDQVTRRTAADYAPSTLFEPFDGAMEATTVWLLVHVPADASLAYSEIGLPGYVGRWRILDLAGLVSRDISGASGLSVKERMQFVRNWRPDWILVKDSQEPLLKKLKTAPWLDNLYAEVDAPRDGMRAAHRKDVVEATPEQALANLERASTLAPRMRLILRNRVRFAFKAGTPAQKRAACDQLDRYGVHDDESLKRCRKQEGSDG